MSELNASRRRLLAPTSRGYSASVVATLAIAAAAVLIISQMGYSLLWAPLPNQEAQALYELEEYQPDRGLPDFAVSTPNFRDWVAGLSAHAELAAVQLGNLTLNAAPGLPARRLTAAHATPNVFAVLGLRLQGSGLRAEGDGVVLSASLYRERHGDAPLAGQTIQLQGRVWSIAGVVPDAVGIATRVDVWLPHAMDNDSRGDRRLAVWARLRPGVSAGTLAQALDLLHRQLAQQYPDDNAGWQAKLTPAVEAIVGPAIEQRLRVVALAVLLLLLLATVNISNLMIARGLQQGRDWATRRALGGTELRLLAAPLAEALWLALAGALLGAALGAAGLKLAASSWPDLPRALSVDPLVALLALLVGTAPVWLGSVLAALLARGRQSLQRAQRSERYRQALVLAQFALATVLLVGAAALVQQWRDLLRTDFGFDTQVLTARFAIDEVVDEASYNAGLRTANALAGALREVPGVHAVALASEVPMGAVDTGMGLAAGEIPPTASAATHASWRIVSDGYFAAVGTALIDGRDFRNDEGSDSVIVSAALAQSLWPGQLAVGRMLTFENGRSHRVVGVVADVRQTRADAPPAASVYLPTSWYLWPTMTLLVRAQGDSESLIQAVVAAARIASPEAPLFDIATLGERLSHNLAGRRQQLWLMQLFSAVSLLLAALGIASVIASSIAQRRAELALRVALGATAGQLRRSEVLRGAVLALGGVAAGVMVLWLLRPWLAAVLALELNQGLAGAAAVGLTMLIALLASALAARPVDQVQPVSVLRTG